MQGEYCQKEENMFIPNYSCGKATLFKMLAKDINISAQKETLPLVAPSAKSVRTSRVLSNRTQLRLTTDYPTQ